MNRRNILSALCTSALALLAPVVAWARKPKAKPLPDGVVAVTETHLMATYQRERTLTTHNAELRALLAEARINIHGQANSERYQYERHEELDDLLSRIDDALKGDKRNV